MNPVCYMSWVSSCCTVLFASSWQLVLLGKHVLGLTSSTAAATACVVAQLPFT